MTTAATYRKGAFGALMDEYERASRDLERVLAGMEPSGYAVIRDPETKDPDCVSVQTIMNHVVRAGYGYANYIRKQFGDALVERKEDYGLQSPQEAIAALHVMLVYTWETLEHKTEMTFEVMMDNVFPVSWGQKYDAEQILEHAIVHILRHRRQIERFLR